ncbi:hypothetical protein FKW77_001691 [Venturia effusa]|uniref:Uncharacterized protein n=1 Tax=Venturia effusa TaxID=50376 RepID=A0A517LRF0_9PEZI|nr:hypothetical protein FKW77_001691 [Venturia effusa]
MALIASSYNAGATKPKEKNKAREDEKLALYVGKIPEGEKKILQDFESPCVKAYKPDYVEALWSDGNAPPATPF